MRNDNKVIEAVYEDILVKLLTVMYTENLNSGPSESLLKLQDALIMLKDQRDRNDWKYDLEINVKLK